MGSPALPDPTFDQTSSTTLSEFSRRKGSKKTVTGKARKGKSLVSRMKTLPKRRSK